jgi:hypothetical protein
MRGGELLCAGRLLRREETAKTERAPALVEFLGIGAVKGHLGSNPSCGWEKLLDFGMALAPCPSPS